MRPCLVSHRLSVTAAIAHPRRSEPHPTRPLPPALCHQRELSGEADLADVERLELIVDTSESSLGRLGSLVPNLRELRLSGSRVSTIR